MLRGVRHETRDDTVEWAGKRCDDLNEQHRLEAPPEIQCRAFRLVSRLE